MKFLRVLPVAALASCAALQIPPAETAYYSEQLALARSATPVPTTREAGALRDAAAKLKVRAAAESERIRRRDETEGLLDIEAPGAAEFVARVADPAQGDAALPEAPLDLEHVLLAVHARNPDVASARATWAATVRMYEQATYLEDLLLRYAAFTRLATPRVGAAPMRAAAFPYPDVLALKGEMIDREVTMAREMTRMRLLTALVAAAKRFHEVEHREQELTVRTEQVSIAERVVGSTRSRVEAGTSPQAELLEMEADLAMAQSEREQALASLTRSRGELNTLLVRPPDAKLDLLQHGDPPDVTPPVDRILAAAPRYSPAVRIAKAEIARTAAAIRMSEAMLFAAPAPGAVATGARMSGAMPTGPSPQAEAAGAGAMAAGMSGPAAARAADAPGLPPRDEAPSGAPRALGPDLAWVAELRERHVALQRAAEEAVLAANRDVVKAQYERDAARRMFALASKTSEPLSAQAVEERMRLYEAGRGEFAELTAAIQRHLAAAHDVAAARHDYGMAEAMLWMAAGVRPELLRKESEESRK